MQTTEVQVKVDCKGEIGAGKSTILNVIQTALEHYGNREAGRAYITFDRSEADHTLRATVTIYRET